MLHSWTGVTEERRLDHVVLDCEHRQLKGMTGFDGERLKSVEMAGNALP